MVSTNQELFLELVRLGIDADYPLPNLDFSHADWTVIEAIAEEQGLSGVVLDGLDRIPLKQRPEKKDLLQLIGAVLQAEEHYAIQWKTACEMALLFHNNAIRTYVLKGYVISECYPNPIHRSSADMDCYLLSETGTLYAWGFGNDLARTLGVEVSTSFYKNSTFYFPGLVVENHKYMVPFRGNKRLKMWKHCAFLWTLRALRLALSAGLCISTCVCERC